MATLDNRYKEMIEKLFEMSGGYVLGFSNEKFEEFILDETGINVYEGIYAEYPSKAKKLRFFLEHESDEDVGKVILRLLDAREIQKSSEFSKEQDPKKEYVNELRDAASKMVGSQQCSNSDMQKNTASINSDENSINDYYGEKLKNKGEYFTCDQKNMKISNGIISEIDLSHELISACEKLASNPASYGTFDEDGLNREIRNFLDSAISRFGYVICDQTQQGFGDTNNKPGELDIRIKKDGIPIAIFEGLIHIDKHYLYEHIEKAIGRYNTSGCKNVFVVEYSRNKGFDGFWTRACGNLKGCDKISVTEENTGLLGANTALGTPPARRFVPTVPD